MKYFNGFCLQNEEKLFSGYIEEGLFNVAGFSFGAQKAVSYVLKTEKRIEKLQLFSPAFFTYSPRITDINIQAFNKDKKSYIKTFLNKAGGKADIENCKLKAGNKTVKLAECTVQQLKDMFTFNWEIIKGIKNTKIEVFLGECDKIINLKQAYGFFTGVADVYLIKDANHFLIKE